MTKPILSIVIPSYNSEKFILKCLESIEEEAYDGVEFIMVDGGSSDKTMEIVLQYKHLFAEIISEKDRGQSHALNKGFKLARGKYLTWLNSDDLLCKGALRNVLPVLREANNDWFAANCVHIDVEGKIIRFCRSGRYEDFAVKDGVLDVYAPSTFFSKKLYKEVGDIDESFHYCMDTDYWWRIVKSGHTYKRINTYFWGFRLHSDAKTANTILIGEYSTEMNEEQKRLAQSYYPEVDAWRCKVGRLKARVWRLLNLSYLKSGFSSLFYKGKDIKTI